ncbi:VOC family protein [Bacillus salitolerans]|uniref:VOC family protein n=1 Tax=Bacillus salitolerans TaxID=1437434 RepID=A0ABW4LJ26_9BACI
MKLFHYHYWTDSVEETEDFYWKCGFKIVQRFGKNKTYHPPLTWNDFRKEQPIFRVIEVRKGSVNITFGEGKRPIFDHIGFLVNKAEQHSICKRAMKLGWGTEMNERRTFIRAPFGLRFELQCREEVIDDIGAKFAIKGMKIGIKKEDGINQVTSVFNSSLPEIQFVKSDKLELQCVLVNGLHQYYKDPNGVVLLPS